MKSNKFKYIYGLFALFAFIATQAQIVFHEDFGSSAVRTTSPYVPQGGSDTQHYEFADARINDDKHREINDNTYAVGIPSAFPIGVDCTQGRELVFPATQSEGTVTLLGIPLGNVVDNNNALGRDLSIHSNINITLSALGLGTTWQNLIFAQAVPANTPITIKIGADSSILSLAGGVTAQPVNADGGLIGSPQAISGSLLELLTGENVYEITFTPLNNGTPIAYNGIRISLGALVGLGANVKVYGAYYQKETTVSATCINPVRVAAGPNVTLNNSIEDVSWGTNKILGIVGAVNGVLTPVNNPYHAIDNDLNTFATMNINVGVAQAQTLSVKLRKEALPGDELRLIIGSAETPLLDLSLIDNFSVQRYLGNVAVGTPVAASSFLLDLNLLGLLGSTGVKQSVIISAINQPFDRVVISYSSLVGVGLLGERMLVYDVAVVPSIGNGDPICLNETLDISKIDCSAYTVSMAYLNKTTNAFVDIANSTITSGYQDANNALYNFMSTYGQENLYVKIQMIRQGCDYGAPRYIKLENCLGNESIVNPVIKSGAK